MSSLQIGRLLVGPPGQWMEQLGDPITNLGGAVIPAVRSGLRHAVTLHTFAPDGASDLVADRLRIRRQVRAMLNNTPLKLQGYLYLQYSDDPEQNGWYVPDQGQLADLDSPTGLATGAWKLENVVWMLAGHRRTNREARNVWMRDLRGGLNYRDTLRLVYNTDFSALPALQLSVFPSGAAGVANTLTQAGITAVALPTARDGGVGLLAVGLADLACCSYERPEASLGLGDVVVYDRRGQITGPGAGPDTSWEESYGPDYPWNWLTAGQPNDAPVLDNGLCRVRYDGATNPGFKVDVWNGGSYVEQGKVTFDRIGDVVGPLDTYLAASMVEYTPDRAVARLDLAMAADPLAHERIFVTMERGVLGATFEYYSAPAAAANSNARITWSIFPVAGAADVNDTLFRNDSQTTPPSAAGTAHNQATAGSGSSLFGTDVNTGDFSNAENWVTLLRCQSALATLSAYAASLIVVQGVDAVAYVSHGTSGGYGTTVNQVYIQSQNTAGYTQAQVMFSATAADQVMEAESMTLGTGATAGGGTDASNHAYAQASRATDANFHVSRATWPNGFLGQFRIWARVKTTATQMSIYAKTGATTGATVTKAGAATPTYSWVDLGEVTANNTTLEIHAWVSSGSGIVEVDRIEAILTQDRARTGAIYSGCRDQAQAAMYDSRMLGAVVAR